MSTVGIVVTEILADVRRRLHAAGISSPQAEAELIVAHALGVPRGRLLLAPPVGEAAGLRIAELVAEREQRTPLQHLLGRAPFRHLDIAVGPGVFVPRPETELLVELAAVALRSARVVVDLCAGSGALALSVAHEFSPELVVAVERSAAALSWLRRNADERAAAGDRPVRIVAGDVDDPDLLADLAGTVDVVLGNPPYVPLVVREQLSPEVLQDPDDAVFAGPDGLAVIPALVRSAHRVLRAGGCLLFEHDDSHAEQVRALLVAEGGWRGVTGHLDLTGVPRFSSAVRR